MKLELPRQDFEKSLNIKFHQNPSSGSRVVASGQTDMTKLIVASRNFANAPKNPHTKKVWEKLCASIVIFIYCTPCQWYRSLKGRDTIWFMAGSRTRSPSLADLFLTYHVTKANPAARSSGWQSVATGTCSGKVFVWVVQPVVERNVPSISHSVQVDELYSHYT